MCVEVCIDRDGGACRYCRTVRCLKGAVGDVIGRDGKPPDPDEYCLCNVDFEATAKLHGFIVTRGWDTHSCDLVLTPAAEAQPRSCPEENPNG